MAKQIKSIENKLEKDSKYISFVEKLAKEALKEYNDLEEKDFSPHISGHNLVPKTFANYTGEDYIVIFNHIQIINIAMINILYYIIDELEKEFPEYKDRFDTGDGDEGCIYW